MATVNQTSTDTLTVSEAQLLDHALTERIGIADAQVQSSDGTSTLAHPVSDSISVREDVDVYTGTTSYRFPFTVEILQSTRTTVEVLSYQEPNGALLQ